MEKIYDEKRCALTSRCSGDVEKIVAPYLAKVLLLEDEYVAVLDGFSAEIRCWSDTQLAVALNAAFDLEDPPLWEETVHYQMVENYWDEDEHGNPRHPKPEPLVTLSISRGALLRMKKMDLFKKAMRDEAIGPFAAPGDMTKSELADAILDHLFNSSQPVEGGDIS